MTQTKTKSSECGGGWTSHDDPIVIDNGPFRVDFGSGEHEPEMIAANIWRRDCTKSLIQLEACENVNSINVQNKKYELAEQSVVFELENRSNSGPGRGTATIRNDGTSVIVAISDFEYRLNGRVLEVVGADMPIVTEIAGKEKDGTGAKAFSFTPSAAKETRTIRARVVPEKA